MRCGQVLSAGVDDDQHCIWWPATDKGCMLGAYLIHPDFQELRRRLPEDKRSTPSKDNTLWHDLLDPALKHTASLRNAVPQGALRVVTSGAALLEAARKMDSPHVLYLGAAPRLASDLPKGGEAEEAAFKAFAEKCEWVKHDFVPQGQRRRRLGEGGQPAERAYAAPTHEQADLLAAI